MLHSAGQPCNYHASNSKIASTAMRQKFWVFFCRSSVCLYLNVIGEYEIYDCSDQKKSPITRRRNNTPIFRVRSGGGGAGGQCAL